MAPSSLAATYYAGVAGLLSRAWDTNQSTIARLAPVIGNSIAAGGLVHTFGSGHSDLVAREIIGRAGGLACINGMVDPTEGFVENLPQYGTKLAERYDRQFGLQRGEVMVVVSNSGKNLAPIDVAVYAKERGLIVVALTSVAMSRAGTSQHSCGKNLPDVADHVLDNVGVPGDALVVVPPPKLPAQQFDEIRAGPTSGLVGCSLLNWLVLATVDWLRQEGHSVPLLKSQNLPGAIAHNRILTEKYRNRLSRPLA